MIKKRQLSFEKELLKYLLIATLIPAIALVISLVYFEVSYNLIALIILLLFCLIVFCATTLYQKIIYQFRTLSNLLEGVSHGDFSMRGRRHQGDDALGQLVGQINSLTHTLKEHRFQAQEGQKLLTKIIFHIDVAILAVDEKQHLALINPAAESLFNIQGSQALGRHIRYINGEPLLDTSKEQVVTLNFANAKGQFQIIRDQYREHGVEHQLFFITDVNRLLRNQERKSWQSLIRVLSHEINNSLAPIASLTQTLVSLSNQQSLEESFNESLQQGLGVINERSRSLQSFIESYRQLSHLPEPKKVETSLAELIKRTATLFNDIEIHFDISEVDSVMVDPVQIEQVLINLLKNAKEASIGAPALIEINVQQKNNAVICKILDQGTGIRNPENLFTPFYSTKPKGSGIGLVLCRQIIEAHQGHFNLENRKQVQGSCATIELPL